MKKIYAARSEADLVVVRSLLSDFESPQPRQHAPTSFRDRLRMIAEMLLFAWFVPGRRRSKQRDTGTTRRRS
jgi:hypothetical protein